MLGDIDLDRAYIDLTFDAHGDVVGIIGNPNGEGIGVFEDSVHHQFRFDFDASNFELAFTDSIDPMEMPESNPIKEGDPLFPYQFLSDGENYLMIYRIKEGKMGREFRICDLFITPEINNTREKDLRISLNQRIKASGARFSSFSGLKYPNQQVLDMGLLPIMKIGPLMTLRKVSEHFSPMDHLWDLSLGDLEVF